MKRQFEGEICVYCRLRPAASCDHVFSRKLFKIEHRGNLPQAPACERCNGQKAVLETYLTAVLPMGSRLSHGIDPNVSRRLANNLKLVRELSEDVDPPGQVFSDGLVGVRTAFQFRYRYLEEYMCMAATALAWHHFGTRLGDDYAVGFFDFNEAQSERLNQLFDLNSADRVADNLGDGTVLYRGIQAIDDPLLSAWQFRLFGGLRLGYSEPDSLGDVSADFVVIVGRRSFVERVRSDQVAAMLQQDSAPAPA